jgi:hypothetical protein
MQDELLALKINYCAYMETSRKATVMAKCGEAPANPRNRFQEIPKYGKHSGRLQKKNGRRYTEET